MTFLTVPYPPSSKPVSIRLSLNNCTTLSCVLCSAADESKLHTFDSKFEKARYSDADQFADPKGPFLYCYLLSRQPLFQAALLAARASARLSFLLSNSFPCVWLIAGHGAVSDAANG